MHRVAAIVLAAGLSRRMGRNKLLIDMGGRPMIAATVDAVLASRAAPVVVVTGHQADAVAAALAGRPVRLVSNPEPEHGLSASLRHGLAALPDAVDGAVICLGDMPFVRPGDVDALIDAFEPRRGRAICVPVSAGRRGNPVLWARCFFPEMMASRGDVGARRLIAAHADQVASVPVEHPGVLRDLDRPEDFDA